MTAGSLFGQAGSSDFELCGCYFHGPWSSSYPTSITDTSQLTSKSIKSPPSESLVRFLSLKWTLTDNINRYQEWSLSPDTQKMNLGPDCRAVLLGKGELWCGVISSRWL